jgi:hypothetical protein
VNDEYESLGEYSMEAGGEFEDDFESLEMGLGEEEFEDFEDGMGYEFGSEYEDYEFEATEGEQFLGGLISGLAPVLAKVAPIAIDAIGSMFESEEEGFGQDFEDTEDEMNATMVPVSPANEAIAAQMVSEAAVTESEAEAQGLAGGSTIHILAGTPVKVKKVAPAIVKRVTRMVKVLRKTPKTRKLIPVTVDIVKRTAATLTKKAKKGKPVTNRVAVRTLAKQAKKVLSSPKKTAIAIAKNKHIRKKISKPAIARAEKFELEAFL